MYDISIRYGSFKCLKSYTIIIYLSNKTSTFVGYVLRFKSVETWLSIVMHYYRLETTLLFILADQHLDFAYFVLV